MRRQIILAFIITLLHRRHGNIISMQRSVWLPPLWVKVKSLNLQISSVTHTLTVIVWFRQELPVHDAWISLYWLIVTGKMNLIVWGFCAGMMDTYDAGNCLCLKKERKSGGGLPGRPSAATLLPWFQNDGFRRIVPKKTREKNQLSVANQKRDVTVNSLNCSWSFGCCWFKIKRELIGCQQQCNNVCFWVSAHLLCAVISGLQAFNYIQSQYESSCHFSRLFHFS